MNETINKDIRDRISRLSGSKLSLGIDTTLGKLICSKARQKSFKGAGEILALKIRYNKFALVEKTKYLGF